MAFITIIRYICNRCTPLFQLISTLHQMCILLRIYIYIYIICKSIHIQVYLQNSLTKLKEAILVKNHYNYNNYVKRLKTKDQKNLLLLFC